MNESVKILVIHPDGAEGSTLNQVMTCAGHPQTGTPTELYCIDLTTYRRHYKTILRGRGFAVVLLVGGVTQGQIAASEDAYRVLQLTLLTHRAQIIEVFPPVAHAV